jgi:hypothetical protein
MVKSLLVLNDGFRGYRQYWDLGGEWEPSSHSMISSGVPALDRLASYEAVMVIGQIERTQQATELAGGLRLAVEAGLTAVVLYPLDLEGPDRRLIDGVRPGLFDVEELPQESVVESKNSAFYRFFGAYGRSGSVFSALAGDAAVLGSVDGMPSAVVAKVGKGTLYVLPFHVAELSASYNPLIRSLLAAITSYEAGVDGGLALPPFVQEMRLPGEEEMLGRIGALRAEIEVAQNEAAQLERYRQIIGHATGEALEELTIEILNVILAETGYAAEDREDVGAEDFWLVEGDEDRALAEVKGIGGSVNRQAVNQVDNHRAERELSVESIPGLLLVNTYRNSDDPTQRDLPVSSDVIKHAVRLNVLVLRTRDLYFLLHQHLDGRAAGQTLIDILGLGGGWLEVNETEAKLRDALGLAEGTDREHRGDHQSDNRDRDPQRV